MKISNLILTILFIFISCSENKATNGSLLLNESLKQNKNISEFKANDKLIEWIVLFDRNLLEKKIKAMFSKTPGISHDPKKLPLLSYSASYALISSNCPQFDFFEDEDLTIPAIHGGDYFYILTMDIGFGINPTANLDNIPVKEIYRESIMINNQITGYIRWWDISHQRGKIFHYQNVSSEGENQVKFEINLEIQ